MFFISLAGQASHNYSYIPLPSLICFPWSLNAYVIHLVITQLLYRVEIIRKYNPFEKATCNLLAIWWLAAQCGAKLPTSRDLWIAALPPELSTVMNWKLSQHPTVDDRQSVAEALFPWFNSRVLQQSAIFWNWLGHLTIIWESHKRQGKAMSVVDAGTWANCRWRLEGKQ